MPSSVIETSSIPATSGLSRFYPLTVRAIQQETKDAIIVTFEVPPELADKFRFIQGQYVTLRTVIGGEDIRRSYSICSAVQDAKLRVGIKRTPGGVFSNWVMENLKAGDRLEVMPPEGRFHVQLSPTNQKHYVAFAAGSGITPILSIIKTTLLTEPDSSFTLFFGNRSSSTVMFREELAELKDIFMDRFSLIHVLSREHQDVDLLNGRITGEKAKQLLSQFCRFETTDTAFLCGPQDMVDEISETLQALGLAESRIKIELFTVSEAEQQTQRNVFSSVGQPEYHVNLIVDGNVLQFAAPSDETILDAGLNRGIDLRHSCKSGVCGTCRAKLIEGQVDMDVHYALTEDEIERGFILTCQSHPLGDHVTVDFDQDN